MEKKIMKCNIQKYGWIVTPESAEDLTAYADKLNSDERHLFYLAVGMTWNLMVDMIEEKYHADTE